MQHAVVKANVEFSFAVSFNNNVLLDGFEEPSCCTKTTLLGFNLDAEGVELVLDECFKLESSWSSAISLQGNRVDEVRFDAGGVLLPVVKLLIEGNTLESVTSICSVSVGCVCIEPTSM